MSQDPEFLNLLANQQFKFTADHTGVGVTIPPDIFFCAQATNLVSPKEFNIAIVARRTGGRDETPMAAITMRNQVTLEMARMYQWNTGWPETAILLAQPPKLLSGILMGHLIATCCKIRFTGNNGVIKLELIDTESGTVINQQIQTVSELKFCKIE